MSHKLHVTPIPILDDNYSYLVSCPETSKSIVIDPGDASPILNELQKQSTQLQQIWLTHFHKDHINGALELQEETRCILVGPKSKSGQILELNQQVSELDQLELGSHKAKVLEVPGHSKNDIAYWFYQDNTLFCGDVLFSLGCGKLLEGTAEEMWRSLRKIRDLPPDTQLYFGHEYTLENAEFALFIDPENQSLVEFAKYIKLQRSQNKWTTPSLLGDEIKSNPFLRSDLPYWKNKFGLPDVSPTEIFKILRKKKDQFKKNP
ncbi:MAG: Hydroxyacylglutathione hydrolase GloB [Chlamydiae bacterium]|nr:Hydroxyacylglutathione hydrolase GloB [Chlamydiota bacterium]